MTLYNTLALAGAMLLLAATPGPGVFTTVARALTSGFLSSTVVIAGIVLGDVIFLLLAIYGLAAIAEILGDFFIIIKYLGGAYLIWLGYSLWTQKPGSHKHKDIQTTHIANFTSGLFITLGNPKIILFYLVFLPAFLDLNTLSVVDVLVVIGVVSTVLGSVMLTYAYLAVMAKRTFKNTTTANALNRVAAGVLASTGVMVIAKS